MKKSKGGIRSITSSMLFVLLLIIFSTPFSDFTNKIAQILNMAIFSIIGIYFIFNFRRISSLFTQNKILILLICYLPFNLILAYNKEVTILFIIKLIGLILVGFYITLKTNFEEWVKILLIYFCVLTFASIMVSLLFPQVGIHSDFPHVGSWKGIVGHKNTLGTLCILSVVMYLFSILRNRKHLVIKLFIISLNLFTIIKANSKTAFVMLTVLLVILLMYSIILLVRRKSIYLTISISTFMIIVVGFLVSLVLVNLDKVLALLGRDRTLTGRTNIYNISYEFFKEKVLFGYGYGGFWNTDSNMRKMIWDQIGLEIVSSHSGILDLMLDFGVIGTFIIVAIFIVYFIQSINFSFMYKANLIMLFPLIYFLFIVGNNITDSRFLTGRSIYWLIFLVTAFIVRKQIVHDSKEKKLP